MFRSSRALIVAVIATVLIICAILTAIHRRSDREGHLDPPSSGIRRFVLEPPAHGIQSIKHWWSLSISPFFSSGRVARENNRLKVKVAQLTALNRELLNESVENRRLRALVDFQARSPLPLLPAEVIALKPSPMRDSLTLSRGLHDHVKRMMVVLDQSGALIGQIVDVSQTTCDVLLLTDDLSSVGGLVVPVGRPAPQKSIVGIVTGSKTSGLTLTDIPIDSDIRVGDRVLSSGLGPIYPKNIVIGQVSDVSLDKATYLKNAKVNPAADFNDLSVAFIMQQAVEDNSDAETSPDNSSP